MKHLLPALLLLALLPATSARAAGPEPAAVPVLDKSEQELGVEAFFAGNIKESLTHWDAFLAGHPDQAPYHWQRGLSLYYAERWDDGRRQFEGHQGVNPDDVENAVWHFVCVARKDGFEAAQKQILAVTGDTRVPMKEVQALFAGTGTPEAVLAAAEVDPGVPGLLRNQRCYAHLYLGLYWEAKSDPAKAKAHMLKAANEYRMNHYMGKVAQVHCQLRGWKPDEPAAAAPAAPETPAAPDK